MAPEHSRPFGFRRSWASGLRSSGFKATSGHASRCIKGWPTDQVPFERSAPVSAVISLVCAAFASILIAFAGRRCGRCGACVVTALNGLPAYFCILCAACFPRRLAANLIAATCIHDIFQVLSRHKPLQVVAEELAHGPFPVADGVRNVGRDPGIFQVP